MNAFLLIFGSVVLAVVGDRVMDPDFRRRIRARIRARRTKKQKMISSKKQKASFEISRPSPKIFIDKYDLAKLRGSYPNIDKAEKWALNQDIRVTYNKGLDLLYCLEDCRELLKG